MRVRSSSSGRNPTEHRASTPKRDDKDGSRFLFSPNLQNNLIQQIRFEHLYSSPECRKPSPSKAGNVCYSTVSDLYESLYSDSDDEDLSFGFCTSPFILRNNALNNDNFNLTDDSADELDDMASLTAESIQRQFQNTINMTCLAKTNAKVDGIDDCSPSTSKEGESSSSDTNQSSIITRSPKAKRVTFLENPFILKSTARNLRRMEKMHDALLMEQMLDVRKKKYVVDKETENGKSQKLGTKTAKTRHLETNEKNTVNTENKAKSRVGMKSKQRSRSRVKCASQIKQSIDPGTSPQVVDSVEWKTLNKCLEVERKMNALTKHTVEIVVRKWGEYLAMTSEHISQCEVENAREIGMTEEAIGMLEDKGRYVWELVDGLTFL